MSRTPQNLAQLLALDDAAFVVGAYRGVLLREPDPVGFDDFVTQIRLGVAKERVIVAMALSEEGRAAQSSLPGLEALCRRYPLQPASGPLSSLARRLRGPVSEQLASQVRALDNRLSRLQDSQSQHGEQQRALDRELVDQLDKTAALLMQVAEAVAAVGAREHERLAETRALRQSLDAQQHLLQALAAQTQALTREQQAGSAALADGIERLARLMVSPPARGPVPESGSPAAAVLGPRGRLVLDQMRRAAEAEAS